MTGPWLKLIYVILQMNFWVKYEIYFDVPDDNAD